ncbi:MAG: ribonuclease III [Lachnospiraceae bacterium]|nr:ribonuclease III [Lachnospiraceae bacterium]
MNITSYEELMNRIGYTFKDISILEVALTHSSYSNEHRSLNLEYNERMEFLGDAVLELVTSEYLYEIKPVMPEGKMTRTRASIVCEPTLAICAEEISLGTYLRLGKGEELTGGRSRASVISDAMEALIGAIYLDGGIDSAKEFIHRFVLTDLENKQLFMDSKTILQEMIQSSEDTLELCYKVLFEEGPDHNKLYTVAAYVNDDEVGRGTGKTKKAAEQAAAYRAILKLQKRG